MFTISCIGCSWTQGLNIPYTHTYPYILHELLNNSNKENKMINAGRSGASWINYPQSLQYIHKKYNPDVYVIQHTTPDRGMLLFSANKSKYQRITRDHDLYDNYIQLWDNTQSYYHLTVGMAEEFLNNSQSDFVSHMLNEIKRKSSLSPGNVIERVKYWYEHERHHPLTFEKFEETIDYCDMYVKRLGKQIIHLFWLDDNFVVGPHDKIIIQKQLKDFNKLVVDNGYHFKQEGNTEVANLIKTTILRGY
tara:strand:- start:56869 stop:57615 length:747 start_codon:yes stop_codon:yes gene_type:complete